VRYALLADIHANSYALEAALKSVERKNIKTLLIAGDFIGYYFWPVETFKLLESWNVIAVSGNHDTMFKKEIQDNRLRDSINTKYGSGLNVAMDELSKKDIDWLINLPNSCEFKANNEKILICHGSPWDEDEYIYPDSKDKLLDRYANLEVKWVVQGHTHYPMLEKIGNVTVINPGSVGQPRNRQVGAQWAMLDTASNTVEHYCEKYDLNSVVSESKKRHPEIPYLADVLERR